MTREMRINASGVLYRDLNEKIRALGGDVIIDGCIGQRYIGAALPAGRRLIINGVAGNATGAYLDGAKIIVNGNIQDAAGDTMNAGRIIVHGNAGDALGYAMRGGEIYIRGNAGYRCGIHMKAYKEKLPVIVVGGRCGSFLGEYQAGGLIIVLGLGATLPAVGYFPGTGMHGGKILLRGDYSDLSVPPQVRLMEATEEDIDDAAVYISRFCEYFGTDYDEIISSPFWKMIPNSKNPYKQLYVQN